MERSYQTRASKSLNALFSLKRSPSATTVSNKKIAYNRYVVHILSYGSSLWIPNMSDLSVLESIERKAVMWILNTKSISYKDMLMKLGILPISLYQEIHVILLFAKILNGKVDINWRNYVNITETGTTKYHITRNFSFRGFHLRICDSDWWLRACQIVEHMQ